MGDMVIFLDDDTNILSGFRRTLGQKYKIQTFEKVSEAIEAVKELKPAVIVSDYKMPEMNGVDFLKECQKIDSTASRILLTGYADIEVAIKSINEGCIFRFLTKPCDHQNLSCALNDAIRHHQLHIAEMELIEGTVHGSIKMVTSILSMTNPAAFGQSERINKLITEFVKKYKIENSWQVEVAAMLCNIGFVSIPSVLLEKVFRQQELSEDELEIYLSHTEIASDLLLNIPRFQPIADIVRSLEYDVSVRTKMPMVTRLIRIARDFDIFSNGGIEVTSAIKQMRDLPELYDKVYVDALEKIVASKKGYVARDLEVRDLRGEMIIRKDVSTKDGVLLLKKGQILNEALLVRINNYHRSVGVVEPIGVIQQIS